MDVDLIMAVDVISVSPIETSAPDIHHQRRQAVTAAALIVIAFVAWLSLEAPHGILCGTDELLTAERSREMLVTGEPWVVHYNFHRSFEKPPLQYWLTSLTLPRFQNPAVALRIWPILYGALTAITLGWLVSLMKPGDPWLIPLAIAVLASAPLFASESSRGLLDVGLTFSTWLTMAFAGLARKSRRGGLPPRLRVGSGVCKKFRCHFWSGCSSSSCASRILRSAPFCDARPAGSSVAWSSRSR